MLARLFSERGVRLDRTYQLNFGGNTDFLNMLERDRLESKKISKTNAVTSQLDYELPAENVHVGPSDYVPWLTDRKWAYIRLEGTTFGNVPLNVEVKLEVWDSPNSAGVVIDAVRCVKLALDRGRRLADRPVGLLHEVAAGADHRRPGPPGDRRLHRRPAPGAGGVSGGAGARGQGSRGAGEAGSSLRRTTTTPLLAPSPPRSPAPAGSPSPFSGWLAGWRRARRCRRATGWRRRSARCTSG